MFYGLVIGPQGQDHDLDPESLQSQDLLGDESLRSSRESLEDIADSHDAILAGRLRQSRPRSRAAWSPAS